MIEQKDLETWAGFLLDHSIGGVTADDRVMIKSEAVCWPLMAVLEAKVIGNQRNDDKSGEYHISVSAERPPSDLDYDDQTTNFTLGDVLTGGTSGATARIVVDTDGGATGTLELRDIVGAFENNEIITDPSGGSATVNGTLTGASAALLGSVTSIRAAREDVGGWACVFAATGTEIELRVTGASGDTVEWLCHVDTVQT